MTFFTLYFHYSFHKYRYLFHNLFYWLLNDPLYKNRSIYKYFLKNNLFFFITYLFFFNTYLSLYNDFPSDLLLHNYFLLNYDFLYHFLFNYEFFLNKYWNLPLNKYWYLLNDLFMRFILD